MGTLRYPTLPAFSRRSLMSGAGAVLAATALRSSPASAQQSANASKGANWMRDNYDKLKDKTLKQLVLPASHDAGMYLGPTTADYAAVALGPAGMAAYCAASDCSFLGRAQDLDIYGQLSYGVRYFDLRPRYTILTHELVIHHTVSGPPVSAVLADVNRFFKEGHRELVILKFSAYNRFDQDVFNQLCSLIQDRRNGLGDYLIVPQNLPGGYQRCDYGNCLEHLGPRLADRPLSAYLGQGRDRGAILVFCDGKPEKGTDGKPEKGTGTDFQIPDWPGMGQGVAGIYRYRDWYALDAERGDLTVFDVYSNTEDLDEMRDGMKPDPSGLTQRTGDPLPQGQLPKFDKFDGYCQNEVPVVGGSARVPCDLFLLSWALTPHWTTSVTTVGGAVRDIARPANAALVDSLARVPLKNKYGQIINLLYTDYVADSHSMDVALLRNGLT